MNALEIKKIRKKINKTQSEFANMLGVKVRSVQYWEGGTREIPQTAQLLLELILETAQNTDNNISTSKDCVYNSNPELELKPIDGDVNVSSEDPDFYRKLAETQTNALNESLTRIGSLLNNLEQTTKKLVKANKTIKAYEKEIEELKQELNKDQNIG